MIDLFLHHWLYAIYQSVRPICQQGQLISIGLFVRLLAGAIFAGDILILLFISVCSLFLYVSIHWWYWLLLSGLHVCVRFVFTPPSVIYVIIKVQ
jgi:hypothetical protein